MRIPVLLACCLPLATWASGLSPFSLRYDISYSIASGTMILSLTNETNGRYTLRSTTQAHGIAKLIASQPITEVAEFNLTGEQLQPLSYRFDDGSKHFNKDISIDYDWKAGQATLQSDKGTEKRVLSEGAMDQFNMQAAAIAAVQAGHDTFSFENIRPGRKTERVNYRKLAEEQLDLPIGKVDTLKYTNSEPQDNKQTYFWFAPRYGYAPIRTERIKEGKVVFKGVVTALN